jgi:hypothetical protein
MRQLARENTGWGYRKFGLHPTGWASNRDSGTNQAGDGVTSLLHLDIRVLAALSDRLGDTVPEMFFHQTERHSLQRFCGRRDLSEDVDAVLIVLNHPLQTWIGCETCLAAHTEAGRTAGLSEADIALAQEGTAADRREAALVAFAVQVLAKPASVTGDDIAELRRHGWSDRVIADVVGLVSLNLLTGAFNLVAGIKPATEEAISG